MMRFVIRLLAASLLLLPVLLTSACVSLHTWTDVRLRPAGDEEIQAFVFDRHGNLTLRGRMHDYRIVPRDNHPAEQAALQYLHTVFARGAARQLIDLAPNPQQAPALANDIRLFDDHQTPGFVLQRFVFYLPPTALPDPHLLAHATRQKWVPHPAITAKAQQYGATLPAADSELVRLSLSGLQGIRQARTAHADDRAYPLAMPISAQLQIQQRSGSRKRTLMRCANILSC